ncbi:GNAT family N-acetyltransferase [Alteromonas sp. a30]|uniref:GNAT family N-acetyltransferase n=1 Tax=Alteromonas sp. a30 TaxID=2730917 RepID=UPI00227F2742|nr:GNAT family N-acetyltransferase [Alteromonas sp. a30]MCY7294525.1 GNAT family N-acetyltransferase [Alteromonas sp. a30]
MVLEGYQVRLEPVKASDLPMLRQWRNDPKISQHMLSNALITEEQQLRWFESIVNDNSQQHFVIYYKGAPIGSANIKSADGVCLRDSNCIEPGLYIYEDKYRANLLAFAPTLLLNDFSFYDIGVEKLKAVVLAENLAALNYNKKLGYEVVSEGPLIEIELEPLRYEVASKPLKRLLSRVSGGK